jgi:hypothetical protein
MRNPPTIPFFKLTLIIIEPHALVTKASFLFVAYQTGVNQKRDKIITILKDRANIKRIAYLSLFCNKKLVYKY